MNLAIRAPSQDSFALPWRSLALVLLATLLFLGAGAAPEAWVFDRHAVEQGEWWRLLSGHWVHSDAQHALWNILALAVLGLCFEQRLRGALLAALAAGSLSIDAWLWWFRPDLVYYCGLSGVLNTLLVAGLVASWRERRDPLVWLIGVVAVMKILLEMKLGQALLTDAAWPSVPDVHAVGFIAGLTLGTLSRYRSM